MRGLILLGGDPPGGALLARRHSWADLTIAADAGLACALEAGIAPHIAVGDFDSAGEAAAERARAMGCEVRSLNPVKDETDGQAALDAALEAGCSEIAMLGGFGGRFDHQFAHVCLLVRALRRGASAWLEDGRQRVSCHGEGVAEVRGRAGDTVSVLPFGGGLWVERVEGLAYPIPDRALPPDTPFGISNVMTEGVARAHVRRGIAVVVHIPVKPW